MKKETLYLGAGVIEVHVFDDLIYFNVLDLFDDEIAMEISRYLDKILDEMPTDSIRVWDLSNLSSESFRISNECVHKLSDWYRKMKARKSLSKAYFIASEPLIFGLVRMYELQSVVETFEIEVLRSFAELPEEIKDKLADGCVVDVAST